MRVKIRDAVYDSSEEPICVQLSDRERLELFAAKPSEDLFTSAPEGTSAEDLRDFTASFRAQPAAAPPLQFKQADKPPEK